MLLTVVQTVTEDEEPAPVAGSCGTVSVAPVSARRAHREGSVVYGTAPADIVERAVHNLEHGYVVIFYGKDVSDEDVRKVAGAAGGGGSPR